MKIIHTESDIPGLSSWETYQTYNGLDCCLTFEVFEEIQRSHNQVPEIYNFTRAMQAPAMYMMLRGLRVNIFERDRAIEHLTSEVARLQSILNRYAQAIWGADLNPGSPKQMKDFLYGVMKLPEQHKRGAGGSVVTTDRNALEKLDVYFHARPIVKVILAIRDRTKQIGTLRSEVDSDRRMRTSYNVAGTETGRWSSSSNAFGTGTNLQNIADKLRRIFIADPGRKLAYIDLEQAESRVVGIKCFQLFGATSYIDACESGDLHTITCRLVWPELPWTGDSKQDREIAERKFYRDYSYRDMSKRGGHGSNYYGRDYTMAKHLKVETPIMTRFQKGYFDAFPEIRWWHSHVAMQLQTELRLTTILGRERHFFGRPNDDTTLREAIAYEPQSVVGDLLNLAAWRIWKHGPSRGVRLLAQLHDAVLIDYPDDPPSEQSILDFSLSLMRTPLTLQDPRGVTRTFVIGSDAAVGWNWGKYDGKKNPGGILGWGKAAPAGIETRTAPKVGGLDNVFPDFH